jgi:hypothetical protein
MTTLSAVETDRQMPVTLHVDGVEWSFAIAGVRRVGRELFVQVSVEGPELCTVTFHLHDGIVLGSTAHAMLMATCEWLLKRGRARHAFIDLGGGPGWIASEVA